MRHQVSVPKEFWGETPTLRPTVGSLFPNDPSKTQTLSWGAGGQVQGEGFTETEHWGMWGVFGGLLTGGTPTLEPRVGSLHPLIKLKC